jgi:hypothetical protein
MDQFKPSKPLTSSEHPDVMEGILASCPGGAAFEFLLGD